MQMVGVVLLALIAVVGLAAWSRAPWWAPWPVTAAVAAMYFFAWRNDATATDGGDPQPALIAVVGTVVVGVFVVGTLAGYAVRAYMARR